MNTVTANKHGFYRVNSIVPKLHIGDPQKNLKEIEDAINKMHDGWAEKHLYDKIHTDHLIVFPELCMCGYTCADLLANRSLIKQCENAVGVLARRVSLCVVGAPVEINGLLYNCAIVCGQGKVHGIVPKTYLPNYSEFYEKRWFQSGVTIKDGTSITYAGTDDVPVGCNLLFDLTLKNSRISAGDGGYKFAIEICEDLWSPIPPSSKLALAGADVIVNLSASDVVVGKHSYLVDLIKQQSARTISAYVYSGAGRGESSTDIVFAGNAIIAENGSVLAKSERFTNDIQISSVEIDIDRLRSDRSRNMTFGEAVRNECPDVRTVPVPVVVFGEPEYDMKRYFNPMPFVPKEQSSRTERCEEILNIQMMGLARRIEAVNPKSLTIGVSGGLDSTLALLVACRAVDFLGLDRKMIIGVTMPCFGTTGRTLDNSLKLMDALGVTSKKIDIKDTVNSHFNDIGVDGNTDRSITYENCQARERTQVLFDLANKLNGFVIGTGDMSELAIGWCTFNGDHMSNYNVNGGVPKTLVKHLVGYFRDTFADDMIAPVLTDILGTPVSPELLPPDENGNIAQITEDVVGPYELHDFFLYCMLRFNFDPEKILFMAENAFCPDIYSPVTVNKWLCVFIRRFFSSQFKRSCMPDSVKVGTVSLSPRGDWRMPSDMRADAFLKFAERNI